MVFSSYQFLLVFLPLTLFLYRVSANISSRAQKLTLILASLVFYSAWDVDYTPLILSSLALNFLIGTHLRKRPSRLLLCLGILFNIALLGVFKYTDMMIQTLNVFVAEPYSLFNLTLPLAISFFTFQQIAYLVDCHRRLVSHNHFIDYALFVLFFPQLIAGPIVHHKEMTAQFRSPKTFAPISNQTLFTAILLIVCGLFKKVLLADYLGQWVSPVYDQSHIPFAYDAWVATLAYSLQIFFDFSAYCEIAMGVALLFGIRLPLNFNSPYKAKNISDFWRRWHITLGRFLRDYLYIPLGGNQSGKFRMMAALFLTMLIGGFWHGAGWQFVFWGVLHGVALCVFHLFKSRLTLHPFFSIFLTFLFCVLAWVPFRAQSIEHAFEIYSALFLLSSTALPYSQAGAYSGEFIGLEPFLIIPLLYMVFTQPNVHEWIARLTPSKRLLALSSAISVSVLTMLSKPQTFIYFNF